MQHTCQVCGRIFYGIKDINGKFGSEKRRLAKYCSKECWSKRATIYNNCKNCGHAIRTTKSENKTYCNLECRNIAYRYKTGEESTAWKGDKVSYSGLHKWLYTNYGTPDTCEKCGSVGKSKNMNWANKSGEYKRDRYDWMRLCPTCHRLHDVTRKRYDNLVKNRQKTDK